MKLIKKLFRKSTKKSPVLLARRKSRTTQNSQFLQTQIASLGKYKN